MLEPAGVYGERSRNSTHRSLSYLPLWLRIDRLGNAFPSDANKDLADQQCIFASSENELDVIQEAR